ncbi:MAG: hypothetical protein MAG795_00611 [Candidatus Woesearchaeota archaeon]|nr:hypothetical protein [Candidatus Woesearchaeota archaeon]
MDKITDKKLDKYFSITKQALDKVKIGPEKNTEHYKTAAYFLDMAQRYFKDAHHFREKGDKVTAFAAINYAHGWLDAGASSGLFDVQDNRLFTVD